MLLYIIVNYITILNERLKNKDDEDVENSSIQNYYQLMRDILQRVQDKL